MDLVESAKLARDYDIDYPYVAPDIKLESSWADETNFSDYLSARSKILEEMNVDYKYLKFLDFNLKTFFRIRPLPPPRITL